MKKCAFASVLRQDSFGNLNASYGDLNKRLGDSFANIEITKFEVGVLEDDRTNRNVAASPKKHNGVVKKPIALSLRKDSSGLIEKQRMR